jgi:hypothetical protein
MTRDGRTHHDHGTEEDTAAAAGPDPAARRRRRRLIGAAVVGGVLIAGVATLVLLWTQVSTRPVTVEEARERADLSGPEGDPSPEATPFRPAVGIYRYRGEGSERLDKPPTSQRQGPDIPGTLTHLDDRCWRLRVDYNTEHWQSWDYCSTGDGLTESAGAFFQRLDLVVTQVETSSSYTCDPPVDAIRAEQQAGDRWMQECRGTSTGTDGEVVSTGPYTYLGTETLDIGGVEVEALHYRRSRTLTGGQSGSEDIDVWFQTETGLILQNEREITVRSDSLIGGVTYEESGSFTLVSMSPTR